MAGYAMRRGSYGGDNEKGCWLWAGATSMGYGYASVEGRTVGVHRAVFEAVTGLPAPPVVRHTCNTPLCFRPDHLLGGTHQDNADDMTAAGRQAKGEAHGLAKLTEEQVREIRASQLTPKELAERYGVHHSTIRDARSGRYWKVIW